jgi:hypothetical protein
MWGDLHAYREHLERRTGSVIALRTVSILSLTVQIRPRELRR